MNGKFIINYIDDEVYLNSVVNVRFQILIDKL